MAHYLEDEFYNQIFESSGIGVGFYSPEGQVIDFNNVALKSLGVKSKSEVIGKNIHDLFPKENADVYLQRINQTIEKDEILEFEDRVELPVGKQWFLSTFSVVKNDKGNISGVQILSRNINERKESQEALEKSEDKFRGVFEYADIGIALANAKGDFIDVNPTFLNLSGYTKKEFLKLKLEDVSHPEDLKLELQYIEKVRHGEIDYYKLEKRIRKKNGEYFWTNTSVAIRRTANGDMDMFIGMVVDISDRKKAEFILKEKNEEYEALNEELNEANLELITAKEKAEEHSNRFKDLVETTSDWIWEVKADGTFSYVSPRVQNLLGYTPDELIGLTAFDLMSKEEAERVGDIYAEYVNAKVPFSGMINVNMHKDGREVIIETNGIPIFGKDGELLGYRGIDRDVTERKKAEQELIAAKEKAELANKLKAEFLNNMSHEIRTPMNGIIGFSEMLHEPDLNDEKKKYYTKIIQNSGRQLLRLIDDILEISALETKQEILTETEFYLNDLLMEIFSLLSLKGKERKIPLYVNKGLPDEQSLIKTDKLKLNKILTNLIENALKFTNQGLVEFGYYLKKESLILYVKDTGIGIAEENHKIIFERFAQENKEIAINHGGLGLGLSISKENAKLLGGDIKLESEKGKGSTFYVNLPATLIQKVATSSINVPIDDSSATQKQFTILVAEDEEVNYLYVEALLESHLEKNYSLIHAINGKEAVDYCTQNGNIDLILMDIKMPVMNGHVATEKIKSMLPEVPIIAQTAYSTEFDKELAFKHGCDEFISKPLNKLKLIGLINKYLQNR